MSRCVHIYDSGDQCIAEAVEGHAFCDDHYEVYIPFDRLKDHPFQKLVTRLVAVILLMLLLIPFYYTLKTLYLQPSLEAQESP